MKVADLRQLSVDELKIKLEETTENQLRLRCNKAIQQLENTSLIKQGRRNIARIKTVLNEK